MMMDGDSGRDINGDGNADNALAALLAGLSPFIEDLNFTSAFDELLADGEIGLGLSWPNLPDDFDAGSRTVVHSVLMTNDDADMRALYDVEAQCLEDGVPMASIDAVLEGGHLSGGSGRMWILNPLNMGPNRIMLEAARLEGRLDMDGEGVTIEAGKVTGALSLTTLFGVVNDHLQSDECGCEPFDEPAIDLDSMTCSNNLASSCSGPDRELCGTLISLCDSFVPILRGAADVDLDNDGEEDALSAAFSLGAVGTQLAAP